MSMVAKYGSALAASALVTAVGFGLVAGLSADLFLQPHYWIVSVSLAALAALGMGTGIGNAHRRARPAPRVRPALVALAA